MGSLRHSTPHGISCAKRISSSGFVTPQGSSAAPGRFVKVINEVIRDLANAAAYLDGVIVFEPNPVNHLLNYRTTAFKQQPLKHNPKLSPSKAQIVATDADFGEKPNAGNIAALTKMPMPKNPKHLCSLLGGLPHYTKLLGDMAKRVRPISSLLNQGGIFVFFTPAIETIARELLAELSSPPALV